ncbi:molybdate ABC transporter substrate-binding protein [Enterococcus sp. AZ103]|uniref:molybdate ABC transporter substrate-binding protein n=1 Tax=Enterococcus sp. AZ103 TaxID=2774628 RepID=UPI003F2015DF
MKKLKFGLLAAGVSLLLLGGCGSGNDTNSNSSATDSSGASSSEEKVTVKIAAAASLQYAFEEKIIPAYEKEHPNVTIEGTYDSSGKLQTQIEQGLDADIFFSAATAQMTALEEGGFIDDKTVSNLLENKLVLIVPTDNPDDISSFDDLTKAETIAIGDPASVPAGQYAQEALTSLGLWDELQSKFSQGTNVTEVLNWVAEGSANAGLVYETDAKTTDKVEIVATAPEDSLTEPIVYPIGQIKDSKNSKAAATFLKYLKSDAASDIFKDYGFTPEK